MENVVVVIGAGQIGQSSALSRDGAYARRQATGIGEITGLVHAAGVSPSQASPEAILHVNLYVIGL